MIKKRPSKLTGTSSAETRDYYLVVFVSFFVSLALLFALHRGLTFRILASELPPEARAAAYLVGSLSDLWVGLLLAIIFSMSTFAVSRISTGAAAILKAVLVGLSAIGLAAHQGYVEFFQFQLEPFHLRYLTDTQFMASNAGSFLTGPNAAMLGLGLSLALLPIFQPKILSNNTQSILLFITIATAGLVAHNRNIHLRVQWFIPENLRTNVLETVYLRAKRPRVVERLTPETFAKARTFYANDMPTSMSPDGYDQTIFSGSAPTAQALHPLGLSIQKIFQDKISAGAKPIILIVLLESLRPAETGLFVRDKPSLTQNMDRLAADGFWFSNAFSTGSVTRAGQEAVLCGNFSGRNSSLMRNYPALKYNCLTDELAPENADLFWYHGGDGRFDGQEQFWRKHSIPLIKTIDSFPADAPKTGWGIGDKTFFQFAAGDLTARRRHLDYQFTLGMMLSVTNHIPWDLPHDFSGPVTVSEPSFLTTSYTDQGVGVLEKALKESGDWESTLIFIASDHGNKSIPYGTLYEGKKNQMQLLQSHINLIVTGGIAEAAKADNPGSEKTRFDHFVGQADIASTLARITGRTRFKTMGKDLFDELSTFPVLAQTEDGLYIPSEDVLISYDQASAALSDQNQEYWQARFHFQAMIQYLNDSMGRLR